MENRQIDLNEAAVPALTISAELAELMVRMKPERAAIAMKTPVEYLLNMVELKQEFNRRVLRYLGYKRKVVYYRD